MTANQSVPDGITGNISRANSQVTMDSAFNQNVGATFSNTSTAASQSTSGTKSSTERESYDLKKSREYYHFLFGALLSYVIIGLWIWSTARFMIEIQDLEDGVCSAHKTDAIECNERRNELFSSTLSTIHNVTFGLLSAVVVYQLGDQTSREGGGLYGKFQKFIDGHKDDVREWIADMEGAGNDVKKLIKEKKGVVDRAIYFVKKVGEGLCNFIPWCMKILYYLSIQFVIWTTRISVLAWIVNGLNCLIFGALSGAIAAGPLHTTGQAWLGIAITSTFSFFGVDEKGEEGESKAEVSMKEDMASRMGSLFPHSNDEGKEEDETVTNDVEMGPNDTKTSTQDKVL